MNYFFKGFIYAINGIIVAFKDQRNLKVQLAIALIVIVSGLYFEINNIEWCVLLITIGIVLSLELLNSAIEDVVNFVSPQYHALAGRIKDIAAGAVLMFCIVAVIVGILIFTKYLLPNATL